MKNKFNIDHPKIEYSQDICFCASKECPIKDYCFRAIGCKSRIYTASFLAEICNHSNVFPYFLQADHRTITEHKYKNENKGGNETC